MLEYIFFDQRPWTLFVEFLREKGLEPDTAHEDQGYMVRLPDDTDDDLMEAIEVFYDEMFDLNERLFTEQVAGEQVHRAGVTVNLQDGRSVQAPVDPEVLNRMLQVVSMDELGLFIHAIVDAVENPDERSLCQRVD